MKPFEERRTDGPARRVRDALDHWLQRRIAARRVHRFEVPLVVGALVALAACSPAAHARDAATTGPVATTRLATDAPAGAYTLDAGHASLIFRVNHLGFSNYTARFRRFDAQLEFDPARPENASVIVTIDANSIETDYPDPAKLDFNALLRSDKWLDTARYPEIRFRSTGVELTGLNAMRIEGELELHGEKRPMVLAATFNGGYAGKAFDPRARIGFSARGSLKRSGFGISFGVPTPDAPLGLGDDIEVIIEAEFSGPAWKPVALSPGLGDDVSHVQ